jgi:hypothetical protein
MMTDRWSPIAYSDRCITNRDLTPRDNQLFIPMHGVSLWFDSCKEISDWLSMVALLTRSNHVIWWLEWAFDIDYCKLISDWLWRCFDPGQSCYSLYIWYVADI